MLLAVGFHYVSVEPAVSPRAIFPVTTEELAQQLELVGRSLEFVSRDDVLEAVAGGASLPERACLVTFDDGLRCQLELALPVLERLGVPAVFFVPGRPLAEGRALTVHKLQALRERLEAEQLLALLERHSVSTERIPDAQAAAHYRYDAPDAARLKYLLNIVVPAAARDSVVGAIFAEVVPDEDAFVRDLYAGADEIRALERAHSAVGAHSYAHDPLARLADDELDADLGRVSALLGEVTGTRPRALSYPYGTPAAVNVRVARRAEAAGYRAAFTMERALNRSLGEPLLLARLDANDAPGGKRPLLELRDGEPALRAGLTGARERYFDEAAGVR